MRPVGPWVTAVWLGHPRPPEAGGPWPGKGGTYRQETGRPFRQTNSIRLSVQSACFSSLICVGPSGTATHLRQNFSKLIWQLEL